LATHSPRRRHSAADGSTPPFWATGVALDAKATLSRTPTSSANQLPTRTQGIDTSTAVGRLFFQIIGAIAECEHALMSERTMDGLAAAQFVDARVDRS
jgi:hypothetical protein